MASYQLEQRQELTKWVFLKGQALERVNRIHIHGVRLLHGLTPLPLSYWSGASTTFRGIFGRPDPLYPLASLESAGAGIGVPELVPALSGKTLGAYAMDGDSIRYFWHRLQKEKPRTIIECGSGLSTLILAAYAASMKLQGHGKVRILSVEQSEAECDRTRASLAERKLGETVSLHHAPITSDGRYQPSNDALLASLDGTSADWLIVDGPSGPKGCRYWAMADLLPYCSPNARWFLDDSFRDAEMSVLDRWAKEGLAEVEGIVPMRRGVGTGTLRSLSAAPGA